MYNTPWRVSVSADRQYSDGEEEEDSASCWLVPSTWHAISDTALLCLCRCTVGQHMYHAEGLIGGREQSLAARAEYWMQSIWPLNSALHCVAVYRSVLYGLCIVLHCTAPSLLILISTFFKPEGLIGSRARYSGALPSGTIPRAVGNHQVFRNVLYVQL